MGANSSITWTDHTFNPWIGCTKISPACDYCYAEVQAKFRGWATWGARQPRKIMSESYWRQPGRWNCKAHPEGRRWTVFCASLADVFDKAGPVSERRKLWRVIRDTPNLEWRLLTKRPQNIKRMLPSDWGAGYDNVRLGVTVENQREADRRLPVLARVPVKLKSFVSAEPLLDAIDLTAYLPWLGQIIVGGESGARAKARPFELEWAHDIARQCRRAGVPVFIKQLGRNPYRRGEHLVLKHCKGEDLTEWPTALQVQQTPLQAED